MKLLNIYSVANDERFLVELIDEDLTLPALNAVIQDRGKKHTNSFAGIVLHQATADVSVAFHRLVYKNQELKSKILPPECLQDNHEPIHVIPYDLDPSIPITVVLHGPNLRVVEVHGLRYSTTIEDLKIKLFSMCKLRPSRTVILKDGQKLQKDHCSLLYYGIAQGTHLDAMEPRPANNDKDNGKIRIFVRPSIRKTQVHWVNSNDTLRVLKEMMYEWTGISIQHQKISFHGRHLDDNDKTLEDYEIYNDCTVAVMRVRGGGENILAPRVGWSFIMNPMELDHFGYLLGKIVKMFSQKGLPHRELIQYLFDRWKKHLISSGGTIYADVKNNQLDIHASHFFYEVRPKFTAKQILNTPQSLQKFLAVLWVTQEILKMLILNPTWPSPSDRPSISELKWEDKTNLENQTSENTRLLLRHSPLRKQIEKRGRDLVEEEKTRQNPRPTPTQSESVVLLKEKPKVVKLLLKTARKMFSTSNSVQGKSRIQ